MKHLLNHPISKRWPAKDPSVIQLYSFPTPNGVKVSIMLEETGLPYEAHTVSIMGEVNTPDFLSLNPNNKIPAIIDPNGPDGAPISLFESGAILIYLAEKSGQLLPRDAKGRYETLQWLMFQMGGVGPMFGQLGYFYKFAGSEIEDERPVERYLAETKRLLNVINRQLETRDWITGSYSIADIAIAPWLDTLSFYGATQELGWERYENAVAYLDRFQARPAVQKGKGIPAIDG
ncbi:MAG: glutathione S-transferase N-terminal domain-containing protein [Paracoccaceae bacterium]